MQRKALIDGLANVAPAISTMNSAPIMKQFWFTGKRLMAYNGGIALSVPFESDFTGAVQDTIFPLLNASTAPECEFVPTEKGLTVKAGAAKFKLNTMGPEDFNFKFPKWPDDAAFPVADVPKFLLALKACKRSLGSETSEAAFKGLTIINDADKRLHMFGYDRATLTHATCKLKGDPGFARAVIPTPAIDQLIRITDGATKLNMVITKDYVIARADGVTLWALLEDEDRQVRPFVELSSQYSTKANSTIDISSKDFAKFPMMLDRAVIITQNSVEVTKLKMTVADNKIQFYSKSSRGVAEDTIQISKGQQHGDIEIKLNPVRLLAGLDLGSLSITKDAAILTNNDRSIIYFVTAE